MNRAGIGLSQYELEVNSPPCSSCTTAQSFDFPLHDDVSGHFQNCCGNRTTSPLEQCCIAIGVGRLTGPQRHWNLFMDECSDAWYAWKLHELSKLDNSKLASKSCPCLVMLGPYNKASIRCASSVPLTSDVANILTFRRPCAVSSTVA